MLRPSLLFTALLTCLATVPCAQELAPRLTDEALGRVIREREQWQNNTLGVTDRVPPPWSPLETTGATVNCWGRSHVLDGSLFPVQVSSQGADLLAAPVSLELDAGGALHRVQRAQAQTVDPRPHQVDVTSTATVAGLSFRTLCHLEYDGCLRVDLSITPTDDPVLVHGLVLQVPVKPERALYYHWFEATRDPRLTNAGALPQDGLRSHFKPFLWLGDDVRGLSWFCESPRGWVIRDRESVLAAERTDSAVVMRIRMVDGGLVIRGPWTCTFGMMATPVRPLPTDARGRQIWRDWLIPLNQSNPWSSWAPGFNNLSGTDDPGTLTPRDPEAMRQWVAKSHREGWPVPFWPTREPMKVIPYSQVVFWSGKLRDGTPSPEIKVFGPEWSYDKRPPGPRPEPDDAIATKEYYWVCPASSFAQFYIYKLNQLIDSTDIDGIYIDGPWNTCANPLHGCGYADDQGNWQREYKIWAFRDLLKRIYCLFYEKRQDPIIHHHTSCWLCVPCISFSHMLLDGEQYHDVGQKVEDSFLDVVPMDKWRAEHTSGRWGPAPFLLPDIPPQYCKDDAATRELLMLTNLHDTALFPAGNKLRVVLRNYQARRMFGVADCDFRGYWDNADLVRCDTPDCLVSVYRKTDGSRCLLVVGNTARAEATAIVRPQFTGLHLSEGVPDAGVDIETGERIPLDNGCLPLAVKARDFRLIALPYYEAPPITAGDMRACALTEITNPGFEEDLTGWSSIAVEGNAGSVTVDRHVSYSGTASCHLHKAEGPGGMMLQTDDVLAAAGGRRYRANCQLRIANSTGAKAYWMISQLDAEGNLLGTNNLFGGFLSADQDWQPLPFDFEPLPGTVAIRLHFLVAFPGTMDAWVDDFSLTELKP